MLLLATLFGVLPVAYVLDQGPPYLSSRYWLLLVLLPVGLLGAVLAVASVRNRVGWRIDESHVEMWTRGLVRRRSERIARAEYVALITVSGEQPGFLGSRPRYQIVLWHGADPMRQILLYAGPSERRFRARLDAYTTLLGLPLNPPGLDLVEMPDRMLAALAAEHVRREHGSTPRSS